VFTAAVTLYGVGVLGAGVFPGNHHVPHLTFATVPFVAGGVTAIMTFKVATSPFRYFTLGLGGVSLLVLAFYRSWVSRGSWLGSATEEANAG
jgi:hypothetical membrane protein